MILKHLKTFEQLKYSNLGIIQDETDTQYLIGGKWYHKSLVKLTDSELKKEKLFNRGRIESKYVISAFDNPIDNIKLNKYREEFRNKGLQHSFPKIKGYPNIIDESDIDKTFMDGTEITKEHIGTYSWILTDGHHRVVAAIYENIPYLETMLDYSYIEEDDYFE